MPDFDKAINELRDRVLEAKRHTPGGEITRSEFKALLRSVARRHWINEADLSRAIYQGDR